MGQTTENDYVELTFNGGEAARAAQLIRYARNHDLLPIAGTLSGYDSLELNDLSDLTVTVNQQRADAAKIDGYVRSFEVEDKGRRILTVGGSTAILEHIALLRIVLRLDHVRAHPESDAITEVRKLLACSADISVDDVWKLLIQLPNVQSANGKYCGQLEELIFGMLDRSEHLHQRKDAKPMLVMELARYLGGEHGLSLLLKCASQTWEDPDGKARAWQLIRAVLFDLEHAEPSVTLSKDCTSELDKALASEVGGFSGALTQNVNLPPHASFVVENLGFRSNEQSVTLLERILSQKVVQTGEAFCWEHRDSVKRPVDVLLAATAAMRGISETNPALSKTIAKLTKKLKQSATPMVQGVFDGMLVKPRKALQAAIAQSQPALTVKEFRQQWTKRLLDDVECSLVDGDSYLRAMEAALTQSGPHTFHLSGETSCGKTEFYIRNLSVHLRPDREPIVINLEGLPETLLESELFGTTKNAHSTAVETPGRIPKINGGTALLDELQILKSNADKLLTLLRNHKYQKIGDKDGVQRTLKGTILFTAAMYPLDVLCSKGEISAGIVARLQGDQITFYPLRERRDRIPRIADMLLSSINKDNSNTKLTGNGIVTLSPAAADFLMQPKFLWPHNLADLARILKGARNEALAEDKDTISTEHVEHMLKREGATSTKPMIASTKPQETPTPSDGEHITLRADTGLFESPETAGDETIWNLRSKNDAVPLEMTVHKDCRFVPSLADLISSVNSATRLANGQQYIKPLLKKSFRSDTETDAYRIHIMIAVMNSLQTKSRNGFANALGMSNFNDVFVNSRFCLLDAESVEEIFAKLLPTPNK